MKLLKALYGIASPSGREQAMLQFIQNELDHLPGVKYCIDQMGNIYVVKGHATTYPCVVAHTDEVHNRTENSYEVLTLRDEILLGYDIERRKFCGIGADDKNGIWVALKCLETYDILKCAFFVQEERGCIGSSKADIDFFKYCRFVIQCDRRGNSDMIVSIDGTELCSQQFIRAVDHNKYGYKKNIGMLSDVAALKRKGLGVSCINLSCGYYEPHTEYEHTHIADLNKCLTFVRHIIEDCKEVYVHKYKAPKRRYSKRIYAGAYDRGMLGDKDYPSFGQLDEVAILPSYETQYKDMLKRMARILKKEPKASVGYLWYRLSVNYPSLRYNDYTSAYNEFIGMPAASIPTTV